MKYKGIRIEECAWTHHCDVLNKSLSVYTITTGNTRFYATSVRSDDKYIFNSTDSSTNHIKRR